MTYPDYHEYPLFVSQPLYHKRLYIYKVVFLCHYLSKVNATKSSRIVDNSQSHRFVKIIKLHQNNSMISTYVHVYLHRTSCIS